MIKHLDRARFSVPSSKGEQDYVVDMAPNRGNGACHCVDFRTRCQPRFDKTGTVVNYEAGEPRSRCKHINAVLIHLGETVAQRLCAQR